MSYDGSSLFLFALSCITKPRLIAQRHSDISYILPLSHALFHAHIYSHTHTNNTRTHNHTFSCTASASRSASMLVHTGVFCCSNMFATCMYVHECARVCVCACMLACTHTSIFIIGSLNPAVHHPISTSQLGERESWAACSLLHNTQTTTQATQQHVG